MAIKEMIVKVVEGRGLRETEAAAAMLDIVEGLATPSQIHHDGTGLYAGMKPEFQAVRYHSLVADRKTLPDNLIVDSETADGLVMGLHHAEEPLFGVQFHPESILTDGGKILLQNFLDVVAAASKQPVAAAASIPAGR